MRRRAFILALPLAAVAQGALVQAALAQTKPAAGQFVDLAPVGLPVVANGRLLNYVFVYARIDLTPSADLARWRDKEPYFRDALVRLGYRTPFTLPGDYTRLDEARLKAALFQAAVAITGPGVVARVELLPGGGPMRRTGLPKPGALAQR
jgi:hypothetical protein